MRYTKELELKYEVDVLVAGGGAAGVAAAVSAARCGKSVLLVEARGSLGGAAAVGLVPSIGPYYDGEKIAVGGIGLEIRNEIRSDIPLEQKWTPFKVEELKLVLDRLVENEKLELSLFTTVCDAVVNGGKVEYLILNSKKGLFAARAKVYIDCTGDADVAYLGGGKYELGDENGEVMPATLCSLWADIDFSKRVSEDDSRIEDAIADGVFTYPDRHLPGMVKVNAEHGVGGGNIGHVFDINPTDEKSLTKAMLWGRRSLSEYERYFKEYLSGFENMALVYTSDMLGIRESRRVVCDYMLSVEDFIKRAVFEDEIGRYFYEVDLHLKATDKETYAKFLKEYENDLRYAPGESYGIPYRSLIPVSFSNMFVAGRCLGADRKMHASVRVIPGCFITGQAAGVAAALASDGDGDVRSIDIRELQRLLVKQGSYLPSRSEN